MKLDIKKQPLSLKDKRKIKLESLSKRSRKKLKIPTGFDWSLTAENDEENEDKLKNFQLFCISIVRDLFENNFKTNEKGIQAYLKCADKNVVKKLNKMSLTIEKSNK